ncbi:hypothetical protein AAFG13_06770 [Bradyrhizobium sp. B124]|uniref:hypothetical protein n=1 Tax=Bradyrhizobium sp. B124 TaxID=3140245 RepID=UPI00318386E1
MNSIVTLDSILEPAVVPAITAAELFGTGRVDAILTAIETQVRGEIIDISTEAGRKAAKSLAYKVARSKTILDEIGKEHVADIKAKSAAIDKERKTLRDRLDLLNEEVRKPVTDWEEAEANRVSAHEGAIVAVIEAARQAAGKPASLIRELVDIVAGYGRRDWQEFGERGTAAVVEALKTLSEALTTAETIERERAELEALRAEAEALRAEKAAREEAEAQAKRDREAAERAKRDRIEAEAREKARAEQAKRDQEAAVARVREEEQKRAAEAIERARKAERERIEQEARDAAAKKAAEEAAEQKRQANKRHRQKVQAEICNAITMECGLTEEQLSFLWKALDAGRIPHVSVNY